MDSRETSSSPGIHPRIADRWFKESRLYGKGQIISDHLDQMAGWNAPCEGWMIAARVAGAAFSEAGGHHVTVDRNISPAGCQR